MGADSSLHLVVGMAEVKDQMAWYRLWSAGPHDVDDDSDVDFHGIDYAVKKIPKMWPV